MANFWAKEPSSRPGCSIVTAIATAAVNASQTTTPLGWQTRQVRIASNLAIWVTVGLTTATANSDTYLPANWVDYFTVTPGQFVSFCSTSTSTGWISLTEMT